MTFKEVNHESYIRIKPRVDLRQYLDKTLDKRTLMKLMIGGTVTMPRMEKGPGLTWLRWGGVLLALLLALSAAHAEEMSMDLKEQLGVPAELEPQFTLIATSPDKNQTEEQIQQNAPDILSLEAAHVGGQRVLFRVTFAHPVQFIGGPLLHFYLDLDSNLETGRQDNPSHRGVDIMVTLSEGSVSAERNRSN